MQITELIKKTRTFRRFHEERRLTTDSLRGLVEMVRFGGSARNCQPLQFLILHTQEDCEKIFPLLGWAGYLRHWKGPSPGERPSAYIICLLNRDRLKGSVAEAHFDLGIATQNMLLVAMEQGIGGCRIGSFSPKIHQLLSLDKTHEVLLVLALGVPREIVQLEDVRNNEVRYWRDRDQVHHVPKRTLEDVLYQGEIRG